MRRCIHEEGGIQYTQACLLTAAFIFCIASQSPPILHATGLFKRDMQQARSPCHLVFLLSKVEIGQSAINGPLVRSQLSLADTGPEAMQVPVASCNTEPIVATGKKTVRRGNRIISAHWVEVGQCSVIIHPRTLQAILHDTTALPVARWKQ